MEAPSDDDVQHQLIVQLRNTLRYRQQDVLDSVFSPPGADVTLDQVTLVLITVHLVEVHKPRDRTYWLGAWLVRVLLWLAPQLTSVVEKMCAEYRLIWNALKITNSITNSLRQHREVFRRAVIPQDLQPVEEIRALELVFRCKISSTGRVLAIREHVRRCGLVRYTYPPETPLPAREDMIMEGLVLDAWVEKMDNRSVSEPTGESLDPEWLFTVAAMREPVQNGNE